MTTKLRAAAFFAVLLLCAACASTPVQNNRLSSLDNLNSLRSEALALVNQARREAGAPPLRLEPAITAAAQAHAEDMARRGFYNHRSPERKDVVDRYRANGGGLYEIIGENIFTCFSCMADSAQLAKFQAGWMRSPGHKRNILDPRFRQFGFGIAKTSDKIYAVQTFVTPRAY